MTTSQRFKWKDRDTAAQDLLKVVYHAPPSVSSRALNLLRSIRSESILPDLETIVMDDNRDIWERRYALRGITSVSSPVDMPQLAQYMERAFSARCKRFRESPRPQFYNSDLSPDLLDSLIGLADDQPSNREWFFDVLNRVEEPIVISEYLSKSLHYNLTDDFRQMLSEILLRFVDSHSDTLTLTVVRKFLNTNTDKLKNLLNKHMNRIVELCLNSTRDHEWLSLTYQWDELREELIKVKPELASRIATFAQELAENRQKWQLRKQKDLEVVQEIPAYKFLLNLYEAAQSDNYNAYNKLREIAKMWDEDVPLRAAATHFIGKLIPKYDSLTVLRHQMKYSHDDWGNEPYSPIRFEAGETLLLYPSPENWECLVDAFFINPRNVLSSFIQDWIAHLTDILSGDLHDYRGGHWGTIEDRKWFHALAELDEKVLERYR